MRERACAREDRRGEATFLIARPSLVRPRPLLSKELLEELQNALL